MTQLGGGGAGVIMEASLQTSEGAVRPGRRRLPRSWFIGIGSIVLVTAIWGFSNIVMLRSEMVMSPVVMLWFRFSAGAVLFLPWVLRRRFLPRDLALGIGTGFMLGIPVLWQTWSMYTISVDQVAFLTAMYVIFTPLGVALLRRRLPKPLVWVAAVASVCGMALLLGRISLHLHIGVLWSLLAAAGLSAQIIGTTSLSKRMTSVEQAGLQSLGAGISVSIIMLVQGLLHPSIYKGLFHWTVTEWAAMLFLAVVATVVAVFLQARGQARVTATEAALAFNMEPVWTAVFAWLLLGEGLSPVQGLGALLIIASLSVVSVAEES
ncbi:DMT family transporter [Alicyclobacillus sp. ALC3]|uniref:DMT family transporter n=1 Tax=Alicyclobacillus sp. ALC3 TaxID=2796143 RepID=UPI0023789AD5|nr:DMT family transporter [Alicyclobacillus sp. ALC3]WDL96048.1 DMT family transporter [Alicyclobacillus sp. ALC3]